MATSTIKNPSAVTELVSSGSTSESWANKLLKLSSTYSALNQEQRCRCYISSGSPDRIYTYVGGYFARLLFTSTGNVALTLLSILTQKVFSITFITSTNSVEINDISNVSINYNLVLTLQS